jgi:hypothetical protein
VARQARWLAAFRLRALGRWSNDGDWSIHAHHRVTMNLLSVERFLLIAMAVIVGCARQVTSQVDPSMDRCYEGAAYGFVDTLSVPEVPRRGRMWLILKPRQGDEGVARLVVEADASAFAASWTQKGDSLFIQQLAFPAAEWTVSTEPRGLKGRLHAESDNISSDSKGNMLKQRTDWPVVLKSVDCAFVPSLSSKTR